MFHKDTKFIANQGVFDFWHFQDGDRISIINKQGSWSEVTIRFSEKLVKMQLVVLAKGQHIKTIICTSDHEWILKNGKNVTELKEDDILLDGCKVLMIETLAFSEAGYFEDESNGDGVVLDGHIVTGIK